MTVFERLASVRGIRSDVPNQELAKELVEKGDFEAIREIADHLQHEDKGIQSDCIKVLYEIGYIKPELIADYVDDFIGLLESKNNRLVWGAMIALSTITGIYAGDIFIARERIMRAIEKGSVITVDAGIRTLSGVAAAEAEYNSILFPYLLEKLRHCRPKSVAQYAESIFSAVTEENKQQYANALRDREKDLNPSQLKRINKFLN